MYSKTISRLSKEYEVIQKNPIPNAKIVPEEENWLIWNFALYGLQDDYTNGIYFGELRFPNNYPLGPPSIIMHTPSGRFIPGAKICVSMSNFHPETWTPSWTISSIVLAIISYMYENEQGVGTLITSSKEKKKLALMSFEYNKNNPKFIKCFKDYFFEFSKDLNSKPAKKPKKTIFLKSLVIWSLLFLIPVCMFFGFYFYYNP